MPIAHPQKIFFLPLHINFEKALDGEGTGFRYLKENVGGVLT